MTCSNIFNIRLSAERASEVGWQLVLVQFRSFLCRRPTSQSLRVLLDFHHLSSQTGARSPPVLWCGAALNQEPAIGPAHLAFGQPPRIHTHAADHILRRAEFHPFQRCLFGAVHRNRCCSSKTALIVLQKSSLWSLELTSDLACTFTK